MDAGPARPGRTERTDMENQKYLAELIGTFLLVFVGTATVVAVGGATVLGVTGVGYLAIALAFGLTLAVLAYTLGPISGGHFNPAVTIGLVVARRHTSKDAAPYIVAQIIGAVLASVVLLVVTQNVPAATGTHLGANTFSIGLAGAALLEVVLTFVLVWTVLSVTEKSYPYTAFGGLAIGLALTVIHLAGIGLSGAGVNPARSLGPALLTSFAGLSATSFGIVYLVAPIIGGIVAAGLYTAVFTTTPSTSAASTTYEA
ncbi:MAG: aquaporin [Halobacteriales archaeon]|nr:aquaporin [Halobacteriales archaeon]